MPPMGILVPLLSLLVTVALYGTAFCEVIYLKDGTRIEAGKVWEEDGLIRFNLKGYRDIIITYSKDIVERIEKDGHRVESAAADTGKETPAPPGSAPGTPAAEAPAAPAVKAEKAPVVHQPPPNPVGSTNAPPGQSASPPQPAAKPPPPVRKPGGTPAGPNPGAAGKPTVSAGTDFSEYDGIEFYNPRRSLKYRTGPDRYHRTLEQALAALAETVQRSPEWVAEHIGNTNDLGQIFRNLSRKEPPPAVDEPEAASASGVLFYDPRRTHKYWTGKNARYRTFEEAVDALAAEYGRSSDWIRAHLGDSNDLGAIHRSLAEGKAAAAKP
jgi:plasmid stabilization system protein ParE